MSGGIPTGNARVRIKGRKGSVVRFLILSISYTLPWIIMLSQLAYYSKVYGPQVLLQMNIAYYLPSIPVLLLFGQLEKLLDAEFGPTTSMAMRLMTGLSACAAIAAYYPFMPTHLAYLLGLIVVLGAVSAVAFSTSYQLVAWFRSADTIALGIGCVASGPLALIIQIALQIGTKPKHWQWIALFEISAAMVVVGMLAALSLLWQYWGILSGKVPYDDGTRQPLLDSEVQEQRIEEEADQQALMLSRMLTLQDPFQGFPFTTMPGMVMPHPSTVLRRAASDDITDRRRHARSDRAAAAAEAGTAGLKPSAAATAAAVAAASAGRHHLKKSQTYAPSRASAPLHAAEDSLYDGGIKAVAAGSGGDAGASSSGRSGGFLAAAAAAPAAAAVAATARQVSLQHYSGLPMVPPPVGNSALGAAWLSDIEQQLNVNAGVPLQQGYPGSTGPGSSGTPMDTPKDMPWLAGSITSMSPYSSRAASPGPHGSTAAGGLAAAGGAVSGRSAASAAIPAPVMASYAESFIGELPQFLATSAVQQQGVQSTDLQHQQPLLTSVLGGSAPVFPLAATLLDSESSGHHQGWGGRSQGSSSSSLGEEGNSGQEEHVLPNAEGAVAAWGAYPPVDAGAGAGVGTQGVAYQQAHGSTPFSGSPVSPSRLQQALQHHAATASQQQPAQHPFSDALPPNQQHQQELAQAPAAGKKGGKHQRTGSVVSAAATSVTGPGESVLGDEEEGKAESLADVFVEVLQGTWMVVLAALISSTLLNCIFPFFTYVESSGMLGEFLPQVLFYTRMLSDIVGRMLPRKKALAVTNPVILLGLSSGLLVASVAFFTYLQVPPRMQHDPYVMVLILLLWLCGGYINTMSYILAPSLVAPRVCTKASALMALTYQVAHILGLVLATGLALALYGDIAGEL